MACHAAPDAAIGHNHGEMARIVPAKPEWIEKAAEVIRSGGLVAFPTETVYGLGANALDSNAVGRIFAAKGRPARNPIIVHIGSPAGLGEVADSSQSVAKALAAEFWPGPLTLVLPKSSRIPSIVTAGGPTVGVRMPDHPIALALIRASGVPIAAPSANRSESVSPTCAQHVLDSLGEAVDLILDGGPCKFGIESTVLDVTSDPPVVLRPGAITAAQIAQVLGIEPVSACDPAHPNGALKAPGQMRRHYAPNATLLIRDDPSREVATAQRPGIITHLPLTGLPNGAQVLVLPGNPTGYAAGLYAALRELDRAGCDRIFVQTPPNTPDWLAISDRIQRAAEPAEQT